MKKWHCFAAGMSLALAGTLAARAQTPANPPPNILSIESLSVKPYADEAFDKVASEYPSLSQELKDPTHVLGMEALTGSPRAMYITGFDSFEALQKNEEWLIGDEASTIKFDALDARQAANISEVHFTIWHYRADLSNNPTAADLPHSHYWEAIIFHMRQGHDAQFEESTKLYRDASLKSGQNVPWATYESMMGVTDAYLVLVPMTSLKDEDAGLAHQKGFGTALTEEGKARMDTLSEQSVASVEDNLWMVNPEWSYVEKSWIDADPNYWGGQEPQAPKHPPAPKGPAAQH